MFRVVVACDSRAHVPEPRLRTLPQTWEDAVLEDEKLLTSGGTVAQMSILSALGEGATNPSPEHIYVHHYTYLAKMCCIGPTRILYSYRNRDVSY